MITVIGVRFREVGKITMFLPGENSFRRGDHVIAETPKGVEYGTVILGNYEVCENSLQEELQPIIRKAEPEDEIKLRELREREGEALRQCRKKVLERGLEMKVIAAEYTFDETKILFYFTADGRVDFRDLVKDLAAIFRMRIELRQVGVRDETKIVGGMGSCGRPLCCHSWLSDFVPVSIRMAKEQNLSLNPQKISGVCGRLMCCLKNEADTYAYLNSQMPKKGDSVELHDGKQGEIIEVNVLKQTVRVLVILDDSEREIRDLPASETIFLSHRKKGQPSLLKKDAMARREAALQEAREQKEAREQRKKEENGEAEAAHEGKRENARRGGSAERSQENRQERSGENGEKQEGRFRKKRRNDGEGGERPEGRRNEKREERREERRGEKNDERREGKRAERSDMHREERRGEYSEEGREERSEDGAVHRPRKKRRRNGHPRPDGAGIAGGAPQGDAE